MRVLAIGLSCGLYACSGSLADTMGPGVSSFSSTSRPEVAQSIEPVPTTSAADSASTTAPVAAPPSSNPGALAIELAGWTIETPESWGEPTPFFDGWLRVPGTGSDTFADNITAEVIPSSEASDEARAAALIAVVAGVADDVTVDDPIGSVTSQGLVVLRVRYVYTLSGEVVHGERVLVRGPGTDLLLTLTSPAKTIDARTSELDEAVGSVRSL